MAQDGPSAVSGSTPLANLAPAESAEQTPEQPAAASSVALPGTRQTRPSRSTSGATSAKPHDGKHTGTVSTATDQSQER